MLTEESSSAAAFVYAHERYAMVRNTSFAIALLRAPSSQLTPGPVLLTPITSRAVDAYASQWRGHHWTGEGGWPWRMLAHRYTRKPRSFHAALWSGDRLCGLCVGRVSKGRANLTLHYMESAPDPDHPLRGRVTPLMFEAALNYGVAMGVDRLLLREPLPGVVERYQRFGFALASTPSRLVYFERNLR